MLIGLVVTVLIVVIILIARSGWKPRMGSIQPQPQPTSVVQPATAPQAVAVTTPRPRRRRRLVVVVITILVVGTIGYVMWNQSAWTPSTPSSSFSGVPADVALPIICKCESGWGHEKNGKVVVNTENTDRSIDVGACQINSQHFKRAKKKFNLDVYKEEDNRKFATILYNEDGPVHWKATESCWGPKLVALGYERGETTTVTTANTRYNIQVITVTREWNRVFVPKGQNLVWQRLELVAFEVRIPSDPNPYKFPRVLEKDHTRVPNAEMVDFRVTDEEKGLAKFELRFTPL